MPGAIDTNGVYIYDEDDVQPTFSDLLNLGQQSVSAAIAAHYASLAARITPLEDSGTWTSLTVAPAFTGSAQYKVTAHTVEVRFDISGAISSDVALTSTGVPMSVLGDATAYPIIAAAVYEDPPAARATAEVYVSGANGVIRATSTGGTAISRARGRAFWTR